MKVLITGGTGTISSGLVQECVNRGYEVVTLTRGSKKERNIKGASYLYCDIRKPESVKQVLGENKFDIVVECLVYEVWQLKISLAIFSHICDQYVFISTAGVYSRNGNKRITESDEKNCIEWSYSRNKIACEKYLVEYSRQNALKYIIVRPTVTYGNYRIPFPVSTRTPGWSVFQRMIDGKPMLAGDNVEYSVIHINDFSKAVVSLFGNTKAINEDFHISSDKNDIFWDDVIKIAGDILNVVPMIIHVPLEDFKSVYPMVYDELKYNKNPKFLLDDTKIRNAAETDAQIKINDGVKMLITSMRQEFDELQMKVDASWNEYCNAVIYYAYTHKHLSDSEYKKLDAYIKEHGITEFRESFEKVKTKNIKWKLHFLKHKLKSTIIYKSLW